jgi:diguanylate cyclase (GGDEF)-like protein
MYARNDFSHPSVPVVERPHSEGLDPLTGCLSCSAFTSEASEAFHRARARNEPFSVLALEINRFEEILLRHGAAVADEVLQTCARLLSDNIRGMDGLCRVDGEKFTITLANEGIDSASAVAKRLLSAIKKKAALPEDVPQPLIKMPVNIGVAVLTPSDATLHDLLARAQHAMERARAAGPNRIEVERSRTR